MISESHIKDPDFGNWVITTGDSLLNLITMSAGVWVNYSNIYSEIEYKRLTNKAGIMRLLT